MKPEEILIAKTAPDLSPETSWWRFCVRADGRFEYEKSSWSEKTGEKSETTTGTLRKKALARIKKIIPDLDDVELDGFIIEDAGSFIIDYRRADDTTGSVERQNGPIDDDTEKDAFDSAWLAIKKILASHL